MLHSDEALKHAKRFIGAIHNLYDAIYEVDILGNSVYVWKDGMDGTSNNRFSSFDQYLEQVWKEEVAEEYKEKVHGWSTREFYIDLFSGERTEAEIELLRRAPDGTYRWYQSRVQLIEKSEDSLQMMIYRKEIDQKKKDEELLKRREVEAMQLMNAINSSYDMIIACNLTQNSYYMISYDHFINHTATAVGVFDELIEAGASSVPEPFKQKFIDAFARKALLQAYKAGNKSVYLEHQQLDDAGELHWVSTHVMFMENPYTGDLLEITLSRQIDDRKRQEEENKSVLRDALALAEQANNAKTDFLSRMSHDIRTPMNAIIGMTAIAEANTENPEKVRECLNKISGSSRFLLGLINDILDLSKIESGKMAITREPFHLKNMLEDLIVVAGTLAAGKNQNFQVKLDPNLEDVYIGDEVRIYQIIMNLLNNANKYTPEQGTFSLDVFIRKERENFSVLCFSVADNGIGISEEFKLKLFEPFTQAQASSGRIGSGLGLAITRNLVHLMEGNLSVESRLGAGSCFTVELPLIKTDIKLDRTAKEASVEGQQIEFHGERILVVEDNEMNQEVARELLEMHNLKVEIASSGEEALELFKNMEEGHYLAVLMDVQMSGIDGYETTRRIRAMDHPDAVSIPIFAMTANAFSSDVMAARNSGMNGHIAKPVDFNIVAGELTKIIQNSKR